MSRHVTRSTWREGLLWKGYSLVALALLVAYYVFGGNTAAQSAIYLMFVGAAPFAILVGVRRYRPDSGRHWLLFGGGLAAWFAGDAYWQSYLLFVGKQAPYPSFADVAYLSGYPFLIAAVFTLVRGWGRPRIGNVLDTVIVSLAAGSLSLLFLLKPLLSTSDPLFAKLIAISFPVADFVVLVALTQLMFRRRVMSFAVRAMTIGTGALVIADAIYSRLGLNGSYTSGMYVDAGWLACYALWGIAALHPSMAAMKSLPEKEGVGLSVLRVTALLGALLAAPIVLIVQNGGKETREIGIVVVVMMLLVGARVWLLQREAKKSQTALSQSDERFRLAQAVSNVGTWDMDIVTGEIALSEDLGRMIMGSSSAPASFRAWQDFIHPDDRERVMKNFADARKAGSNFEHEYRFRQPDGPEGWMYSRGRVLLDDTGAPVRALGVAVDITGRHRTELQLKRSEEHFRLAEAAAKVGSWDMDLKTGELLWSDSLRALMGVSADVLPTHDVFVEWIHPEDRAWVERDMAHTLEHGGEYQREYRFLRADGVEGWVESRGRALVDDEGTPVRAVGVLMDTTDRHHADDHRTRLEHQLRQAHKLEAVGRLAGGVAHDFNNILLAIRGNGELALDALKHGKRSVEEEVGEMVAAAERAAALTSQLLAFSRRQVLQAEVLDLNLVVGDMDKLLRRMIGDDVELHAVLGEDPVRISADRSQVEQVIANLAVNARDAMPVGGLLTLEVTAETIGSKEQIDLAPGRYAKLTVSDTGIGMDPETVAKIFEPFFTTKEEGTGFGLSTVHGIVVQSGGSIWVYSEVGQGTTFKIFLPLAEQAQAVQSSLPKIVPSIAKSFETILLVEDDPHVQRIVRNILTRSDYRVLAAGRAEEAVLLAEKHDGTIHLLLSDLVMPGTSGRELAEQIQVLRPEIGILYMSGYTDDAVIRRGVLEAGMAFIQKPFGAEDLGRRVREVLDGQAERTPAAA